MYNRSQEEYTEAVVAATEDERNSKRKVGKSEVT